MKYIKFLIAILLTLISSNANTSEAEITAICGTGQTISACVDPAWPAARLISIWVSFPNETDKLIPTYVNILENDFEEYYNVMSYGKHKPDLVLIRRPYPHEDTCYIASKESWEYNHNAYELNKEIIQKVYNDFPTAFVGAHLVMVNYLCNFLEPNRTGEYFDTKINLPGIYVGNHVSHDLLAEIALYK